MPILHSQFQAQAKSPDGKLKPAPPSLALQQRGPVVQVSVTLPEAYTSELTKLGKTIPPPEAGLALIDTGASSSCIDDETALRMALPVIDVGYMCSASHAKTPSNIYPIQVALIGFPIQIQSQRTMGAALKEQGLLLLLGRDVLAHFTLFYNGPAGEITLAI